MEPPKAPVTADHGRTSPALSQAHAPADSVQARKIAAPARDAREGARAGLTPRPRRIGRILPINCGQHHSAMRYPGRLNNNLKIYLVRFARRIFLLITVKRAAIGLQGAG
ncbi:hypothetical protein ACQPZP_17135 [Spirillospora sp. CA-142024]|uniref:hypothetical protein n=1 Tax=Spirillospora sp. CA-142024 TaxID=3240036 RepID=UPI003D90E8BC